MDLISKLPVGIKPVPVVLNEMGRSSWIRTIL